MVTVMALLLQVDEGTKSKWYLRIEALTGNQNQRLPLDWTDNERKCVAPRRIQREDNDSRQTKRLALDSTHAEFDGVWSKFRPLTWMTLSSKNNFQEEWVGVSHGEDALVWIWNSQANSWREQP